MRRPSFETVAGKTYYIAGTAVYGEYVLNIDLSTIVLTSPTNGAHFLTVHRFQFHLLRPKTKVVLAM